MFPSGFIRERALPPDVIGRGFCRIAMIVLLIDILVIYIYIAMSRLARLPPIRAVLTITLFCRLFGIKLTSFLVDFPEPSGLVVHVMQPIPFG